MGAVVALLLIAFFQLTGGRALHGPWFDHGAADAELILSGQWWRVVTALTLHADFAHVFGNAVACVVFVTAVGQWLGPGVGGWLVLLSGAAGNLITALVHRSGHVSIGASTATFGAMGIIAALQYTARRRGRSTRTRAWLVVAASLALLGLLGTSERADVFAHLFGLLSGAVLGLIAARATRRPMGQAAQWVLAALAVGAVVGCWRLAHA